MNTITHKLAFASLFALFACSSPQEKKNEQSGADFLENASPVYDAKAIDPKAPILEITLTTFGNTMEEMKFDKDTLKVKTGSTVVLTLVNGSIDQSMQHNFVLISKGSADRIGMAAVKAGPDHAYIPESEDVLVHTSLTKPGEKVSIIFPAPPAGTYEYICTYPGHYAKMRGLFVVEN